MHHPSSEATPGDLWISSLLGPAVAAPVRKFIHNALKLHDLDRLYLDANGAAPAGGGLSDRILRALDIDVFVDPGDVARFPKSGPVLVVANHPSGLLDGLMLDSFLSRVRPDARILANELVCSLPEVASRCVPVEVLKGHAQHENSQSLRKVVRYLRSGGAIAIFPAGEVSHWKHSELRVTDPEWSEAAARIVRLTGATVVPIYFPASNGMAFQLAGFVHPMLRTMRLPAELLNKRGQRFEIRVGTPFAAATLEGFETLQHATEYLHSRTYLLEHRRSHVSAAAAQQPPVPAPAIIPPACEQVQREAGRLVASKGAVLESGKYCVLLAAGWNMDALLTEIGRTRETTFHAAGEGTGNDLDLDRFDPTYSHLILWDQSSSRVAGGYRLAWTADILPSRGIQGLYTDTLFRFKPGFFERLGPAVELGRSYIRPEYQREFQPLLLLWQAISRCVSARPEAPVLFGAVSISAKYTDASRALIASFISRNCFDRNLSELVRPRKPFRSGRIRKADLAILLRHFADLDDLTGPIRDIEENRGGVPVLIRQYLRLGGQIAAWNVDGKFSGVLDGLVVVDLRKTEPRLLEKYMGRESAREFLEFQLSPGAAIR